MRKALMLSYFTESRDPSYDGSAMCPESPRKDWRPSGYTHGKAAKRSSKKRWQNWIYGM